MGSGTAVAKSASDILLQYVLKLHEYNGDCVKASSVVDKVCMVQYQDQTRKESGTRTANVSQDDILKKKQKETIICLPRSRLNSVFWTQVLW